MQYREELINVANSFWETKRSNKEDIINRIQVHAINQVKNGFTSFRINRLKREDEKLDFNKKSLEIYNHIRGLSDETGAYAILDGKVVKIYSSRLSDHVHIGSKNGEIVKIYDDGIGISTADTEIVITSIKMEGKTRVSVKDYLNGKDRNRLLGKIFN